MRNLKLPVAMAVKSGSRHSDPRGEPRRVGAFPIRSEPGSVSVNRHDDLSVVAPFGEADTQCSARQ